ncbi:unnamed protein product [Closterium sp. Naga37s-1]|nr:unnamed protein product [Closterium sp. Naga37s-1]
MDLENDGAAGTAAVWATVSPPQIPLVDGFSFHQAPPPCAAAGSAENNEWGGGFMGEWADGKCSEEQWRLENKGDSWGAMREEGMVVEGAAEAPPTPLIQAIARKNISASAEVSPNNGASAATRLTNGWDPLHLNLQPRENVQENLQEKLQWQVGQGNDGSCLTTSPSAATSAGGGCASRRSLGGVTPSAATSAYAAGVSFGPAIVAPAIPLLTLPPSASFTGPPPSAAASHGTGNQTTECGGHVSAAWFTPTATSATNVSPASLMSALGSLQGKIAALQLLIPLVAQSGPAAAVREQQEAAAVGVAAVIQQVALAAVGLLPPRLQAQLLLPDIAGVVRAEQMCAEQAERQAGQEQSALQCAENEQRSAENQLEEAQRERGQQEAMMMALAQALQLQEQQQQQHEPQEQKHYPVAPSPPPPPPCEVSLPTFAPGASPPSAAPPPAPLAPADPLAVPAAAPLLPHFPPPLASPAPASPDSAAASGAGASTEGDDSEAVKEGEQNRAGGSKRGRDLDCEVEAAMGEGPLKQAKLEESQAADAFGKEAAPAVVFETASRSASGTASEAAPGAASGGESMEGGYEGPKAAAGSADTTATATASDTATVTATASDSDEEAAAASSGGGAGEWMIVELRVAELTNDQMHFCDACGKGFKREANLRMHIKAHGRMAPTHPAASPPPLSSSLSPSVDPAQCRFSCPVAGCKRHREHAAFQPLKTVLCVRNHYRRSHCPKLLACSRCGGAKRFAVLADLRTHEKHCGLTSWTCSCGSRFSRKDKLMAHLVTFIGHSAVSPGNNRA